MMTPRDAPITGVIGHAAVAALIDEPRVWPRFGLVGPDDGGAHLDMDYALFMRSAGALAPYFGTAAALGGASRGHHDDFEHLRAAGIAAERDMFAETAGINTHKGSVFLLGILVHGAAAALSASNDRRVAVDAILRRASAMSAPSIRRELAVPHRGISQTYGEWALCRHGWRGVRGVVADGFRSIAAAARWFAATPAPEPRKLGVVRHYFLASSEDTNLLKRAGLRGSNEIIAAARASWQRGSLLHPATLAAVRALDAEMCRRRWSASGSGDLMAAFLFLVGLRNHGLVTFA